MRQPGKLVQVLADEQLSVDDVINDGRYVWVAASHEWGLSVLDRDGKELVASRRNMGCPLATARHGGIPPRPRMRVGGRVVR